MKKRIHSTLKIYTAKETADLLNVSYGTVCYLLDFLGVKRVYGQYRLLKHHVDHLRELKGHYTKEGNAS